MMKSIIWHGAYERGGVFGRLCKLHRLSISTSGYFHWTMDLRTRKRISMKHRSLPAKRRMSVVFRHNTNNNSR